MTRLLLRSHSSFLNINAFFMPAVFILAGAILRYLWMKHSFLGLDERYSLYFSTFPFSDLLWQFQSDTHAGYFYALLRLLNPTQHSVLVTRMFLNLLPLILSSFLICWWHSLRDKSFTATLSVFFLWFHPFIFSLTWSIRFYGWVLFWSVSWYVVFAAYTQYRHRFLLTSLFFLTLIGTTFHLFFPLLWCAALFLWQFWWQKSLSLRSILFSLSGLGLWLYTIKGVPTPNALNGFSWVNPPSLERLTSLLLVLLGSIPYEWSDQKALPLLLVLILAILVGIFFIRGGISRNWYPAMVFLLGSVIFFFFLSQTLLFLSHRRYIHVFIPQLSLFHPRVIFPFFVVGMLTLFETFSFQIVKASRLLIISSLIAGIWSSQVAVLTWFVLHPTQQELTQRMELEKLTSAPHSSTLYWPGWTLFWTLSPQKLLSATEIEQYFTPSFAFERFWHDSRNTETACHSLQGKKLIINTMIPRNAEQDRDTLTQSVAQCCSQESGTFIQYWNCREPLDQ